MFSIFRSVVRRASTCRRLLQSNPAIDSSRQVMDGLELFQPCPRPVLAQNCGKTVRASIVPLNLTYSGGGLLIHPAERR